MPRSVEFNLLDRPRNLRFDIGVIGDLEENQKCSLGELMSDTRMGFHTARILLSYGLRHEDRMMTVPRVNQLLQEAMEERGVELKDIVPYLLQALEASGLFKAQQQLGETTDIQLVPNAEAAA